MMEFLFLCSPPWIELGATEWSECWFARHLNFRFYTAPTSDETQSQIIQTGLLTNNSFTQIQNTNNSFRPLNCKNYFFVRPGPPPEWLCLALTAQLRE